ncbi:MAG: type II toxin-antitoxin system RelE/ParE family toxin [Mobiluncus porci]|uniref:Type II toxin-antitoxin system RelE/ParE family toxin n=1 Tax=Mobiluncus porci TaxID=2652278 RepID=A0A7K0K0E3_9ACTO|nr:type II toxin-antitoxin system RelE/ParE family toxin [Mobiluncus porci]MDD7541654.1 type II toxin-antitoxin system RelE/ParE family toxin [Mobiluncus porci]MDY5748126.1 type II toxin-antitoxin system RelE/ParE family toxin [Mobiluncus porci]MST48947.1 type II toxin-antitoxin system RelE/ParE family toxin [Mobiluncus porci]
MRVIFTPEAFEDLAAINLYLSQVTFLERADGYVDDIIAECYSLGEIPVRGISRDDIRSDLRILGFRRSAAIAFLLEEDAVVIMGVFYGGQDFESKIMTRLRD